MRTATKRLGLFVGIGALILVAVIGGTFAPWTPPAQIITDDYDAKIEKLIDSVSALSGDVESLRESFEQRRKYDDANAIVAQNNMRDLIVAVRQMTEAADKMAGK